MYWQDQVILGDQWFHIKFGDETSKRGMPIESWYLSTGRLSNYREVAFVSPEAEEQREQDER